MIGAKALGDVDLGGREGGGGRERERERGGGLKIKLVNTIIQSVIPSSTHGDNKSEVVQMDTTHNNNIPHLNDMHIPRCIVHP